MQKKQLFGHRILFAGILLISLFQVSCHKNLYKRHQAACNENIQVNKVHPMKDSIQKIIDKYIAQGIPGIQVVVKNNQGWYFTSGGYSNTEQQESFKPCTPGWLFSLTKTYTAALIMRYKEKGLINPDKVISTYLTAEVLANIENPEKITVRMLMNHSSGLVNFTGLPEYQADQFNHPYDQPTPMQAIKYIHGKALEFEPGTDYLYSNTNYLLLYFMLEKIGRKKYEQLVKEEIIQPLHLEHTWCALSQTAIDKLGFPNYYFDRNGNSKLENGTQWNNHLANASYGYGNIAATAKDVILFYEALQQGKVVNTTSLKEMKTWVQGKESTQPDYGLGLEYFQYAPGSEPQFGHEGDGVGNSVQLMYIPANNTYLYAQCNVGRQIPGPYLFKITDMKNELCRYVARWK